MKSFDKTTKCCPPTGDGFGEVGPLGARASRPLCHVADAFIEFMGDLTAGRILIGEDGVEPLFGVTALESAGIEVDPVSQRLKRLPALRLKHLVPP